MVRLEEGGGAVNTDATGPNNRGPYKSSLERVRATSDTLLSTRIERHSTGWDLVVTVLSTRPLLPGFQAVTREQRSMGDSTMNHANPPQRPSDPSTKFSGTSADTSLRPKSLKRKRLSEDWPSTSALLERQKLPIWSGQQNRHAIYVILVP